MKELQAFCEANGGVRKAAKILGVHHVTIYAYLNGTRVPGRETAKQLEKRSKGLLKKEALVFSR